MRVDILALVIDACQYEAMRRAVRVIDAACCPPVLRAALGEEEAEALAGALRVVADPARLRLLSLIAAHDGVEACVCDLTGSLGLSQPTVTHHLQVLHRAGLLDRERRGRWVFYRLVPERMDALRGALAAPA